MNYLGIDVGEKKIGLAIADSKNQVAVPIGVIENNNAVKDRIRKIADDRKIGIVIVGMPYTLKGERGKQAETVFKFLKNNIKLHDTKIEFEDERFTSKIPLKKIPGNVYHRKGKTEAGNSKIERKHIDSLSACIILQDYLDKRKMKK